MTRKELYYALSGIFECEMLYKNIEGHTPNMILRNQLRVHLATLSDKEFFRVLSEFVRDKYLTEEHLNSNMVDIRFVAAFIRWIEESDITDREFTSNMQRDFPFSFGEKMNIMVIDKNEIN